jgi:hypothetical protein
MPIIQTVHHSMNACRVADYGMHSTGWHRNVRKVTAWLLMCAQMVVHSLIAPSDSELPKVQELLE